MLGVAGLVSFYLMTRWPKVAEPENPLAKYKKDDLADPEFD